MLGMFERGSARSFRIIRPRLKKTRNLEVDVYSGDSTIVEWLHCPFHGREIELSTHHFIISQPWNLKAYHSTTVE